jgi:3-oxoacyl-[acyl-carrier-protein] synthase-3
LWSDGAGAVVLEGGNLQGFIGAAFQADGAYASGWAILAGGTFEPASIDAVKAGCTQMRREKGNYPPSVNEEGWPRLFKRLAAENGFTADDVDQLLFTQVSKPSIVIAAERCGVPMEKCHTIMEKYGCTGPSCIPMALDDAIELGKIKRGDLVVMISSGLGYNPSVTETACSLPLRRISILTAVPGAIEPILAARSAPSAIGCASTATRSAFPWFESYQAASASL